eukprot:CAMPEP_0206205910 /NCGR_PEP_ID=MMETSP0166-20121206/14538_1 /ASSEMBLY_ACC=CAM_ASM_000260 /TAXON_ID=95228 /ORGANISM="Vannella robusta, Strain DIVA3 518/3/11/1/6" /LENGTH=194 /DNA_ID=CAMNT_0053626093 /DNA_START=152 /DNA_END=736 /DNA_ORIENTATION=+
MRARGDVNYDDSMSEARFVKMVETGVDPGARKRKRKELEQEAVEFWDEGSVFGAAEEEEEEGEDEDDEDEEEPHRKKQRTTNPVEQNNRNKKLNSILQALQSSFDRNRARCELFMVLPSPKDYADYYRLIKDPIDITTISQRIEDDYYNSISSFQADIDLLFNNAKRYNVEGSQVHTDAVFLQNLCHSLLKELS